MVTEASVVEPPTRSGQVLQSPWPQGSTSPRSSNCHTFFSAVSFSLFMSKQFSCFPRATVLCMEWKVKKKKKARKRQEKTGGMRVVLLPPGNNVVFVVRVMKDPSTLRLPFHFILIQHVATRQNKVILIKKGQTYLSAKIFLFWSRHTGLKGNNNILLSSLRLHVSPWLQHAANLSKYM